MSGQKQNQKHPSIGGPAPEADRIGVTRDDAPAKSAESKGDGIDETRAESPESRRQRETAFGPPADPKEVGTLGPYRIVRQLGRGGMGAVYLAIDSRLNRKLALKVMLPEFAADPAAKERFLREARAAAQVSHDNVVTVYEADERGGVPYIAMQFLQGYPLDEYLRRKGRPEIPQIVRLAREAAAGLAAAHRRGLVHRDIKPANLWLEAPKGRVKVLDFGLAKPLDADIEMTKSGAILGTPAYMSPEQARGRKLDARTDLFSLGAVLYQLCTGRFPFEGPTFMAVLTALAADEPPPVRELNPAVPPPLADLIHQLLAKDPGKRPATADEVVQRLRTIGEQLARPGGESPGAAASLSVTALPSADPFEGLDLTITPALPSGARSAKGDSQQQWVWVAAAAALVVVAIIGIIVGNMMGRAETTSSGAATAPRQPTSKPAAPPRPVAKSPALPPPAIPSQSPTGQPPAALAREAQVTGELHPDGLAEVELDVKVATGEELTAQLEITRDINANCGVDLIRPRLEGPAGTLDLSNVRRLSEATGWGQIRRGLDNEDKDILYQGRVVPESLWFHAPGHLSWIVPPGYDRFRATVVRRGPAAGCRVRIVVRQHGA